MTPEETASLTPSELIDPEDFPFTEPELCAALALVRDLEWATRESRAHATAMRYVVVERAVYRAALDAYRPDPTRTLPLDGSAVPVISYPGYVWYPEEALALLSFVSEALARRVAEFRADRRARDRARRERQAVWRATGLVDVPVPRCDLAGVIARHAGAHERGGCISESRPCRLLR
jgi:hypothetical protein